MKETNNQFTFVVLEVNSNCSITATSSKH